MVPFSFYYSCVQTLLLLQIFPFAQICVLHTLHLKSKVCAGELIIFVQSKDQHFMQCISQTA